MECGKQQTVRLAKFRKTIQFCTELFQTRKHKRLARPIRLEAKLHIQTISTSGLLLILTLSAKRKMALTMTAYPTLSQTLLARDRANFAFSRSSQASTGQYRLDTFLKWASNVLVEDKDSALPVSHLLQFYQIPVTARFGADAVLSEDQMVLAICEIMGGEEFLWSGKIDGKMHRCIYGVAFRPEYFQRFMDINPEWVANHGLENYMADFRKAADACKYMNSLAEPESMDDSRTEDTEAEVSDSDH